ncbi:bifunctional (p)ppGpp synthetase/guanosine-3',5'-bis(diphosphate) 3'-pyrophosphohydrolase [Porphyromonas sp. COT-239 OH1446]|uniref:RelA/SpoT family protein n=1 Tax=Porphyromonas sp. COT-239 OH1446 TaxID=1515613 RepID=UPI00052CC27E|nr:HD domain-containing protein [Porphyromonas sp. COT-239 OH1446]KGN71962.1 MFS transporter [Porphyromonas sp. COT-239 OH1446]
MTQTTERERRIRECSYELTRGSHLRLDRSQRQQLIACLREGYEAGAFAPSEHEPHSIDRLQLNLEVACIAQRELGLDVESLLALLLFRACHSGALELRRIEELFGGEPARLIRLLSRTSELYLRRESISSENFHNLLLSMAEDIRVVLLIIADRLYLLRHAKALRSNEHRLSLAVEVSFLYAPLAHRLGLYKIKGEMEDLCLKYQDRETFDMIKRRLGETKQARDAYIDSFIAPVRKALESELDVPFEMKGRVKSISSIHNKLRKQSFEDIYDLFAIRVILDVPRSRERQLCWQVYSIITDMYRPNPERLKDWISIPKSNGYESLHITVMGPENKWVEVQIRSKRMDAVAEQGVAAHWRYKGIKGEQGLDEFLASVRETLEAVRSGEQDKEALLESSVMTLRSEEIYVFTPKGEVLKLPKGATVLDFAFAIHSRVGATAISGKVNGKNVSIKHQLRNGDSVEIITSQQQNPRADWLSFVVSSRAKNRIRQILRAEEEAGLALSKEMVQRRIKNRKLPFSEQLFSRLLLRRGYKHQTDFYRDLAQERLDLQAFLDFYETELRQQEQSAQAQSIAPQGRSAEEYVVLPEDGATETRCNNETDILVIDQGLTGVEYSFAKCCQPVFGDQIFGFVSGRGIKIHRLDCPNARDMFARTGHRVLMAKWTGSDDQAMLISIEVIGRDDIAVVTNITSLIKKDPSTKIRSYSIDSADGLFRGTFTLYVSNRSSLTNLIKKIRGVVGVKQVERL